MVCFPARIVQVIYGHFDIVTCITKSESNTNHDCYIVTGSKDCTVMVWQFNARTQAIVGDIGSKYITKYIYIYIYIYIYFTTNFIPIVDSVYKRKYKICFKLEEYNYT